MTYVRNAWYMAGWSTDFPDGSPVGLTLLDEPLVAYRTSGGAVTVLEDRCCHRLAPLSRGQVEGDDLRCLYHGLKFGPDGACNEVPGGKTPPRSLRVRAWPVIERHSGVFIWMGDPERADASLLPDFVGVEDPRWQMLPGRMDYDANYELIQDNLLDLSHVAWVHRNSFGRGEAQRSRAWSEGELEISELGRGVRVTRWMRNAPTPPRLAAALGPQCDRVSSFDYLVPGFFLMRGGVFPAGSGLSGADDSIWTKAHGKSFTAQAVTPLTRRRTAYHFCFGPSSDDPDAERLKIDFRDLALMAFAEDKVLIEAQQKIIDADPARQMVLFDVDKAPAAYRRVVRRLLESESQRAG
jgi:vanillate O-demethylase monooxygenase subunit